jgi:hypothetical protein
VRDSPARQSLCHASSETLLLTNERPSADPAGAILFNGINKHLIHRLSLLDSLFLVAMGGGGNSILLCAAVDVYYIIRIIIFAFLLIFFCFFAIELMLYCLPPPDVLLNLRRGSSAVRYGLLLDGIRFYLMC